MPAQPRRWVTWVPALGLVVQVVRIWRGFRWLDEPAVCPRGTDAWRYVKRAESQLRIALGVTAATLVGIILLMIVVMVR